MSVVLRHPSEDEILADLRALLVLLLPACPAANIVQGQVNRTPAPGGSFVLFFPVGGVRLDQNVQDTVDNAATGDHAVLEQMGQRYMVQLEAWGEQSKDWADALVVGLRSEFACDNLTTCQPLYCDDPQQAPAVDDSGQWYRRWVATASLQVRRVLSTPMQFADKLDPPGIYPPVQGEGVS